MKKNILLVIFIIIAVFVISKFSDHNLKKTISACILAQLQTAESPDVEKAKKVCEERIKK
jgi:hypothetical protein|tara:strand:- start:88 stop:267 length:180 start_codon:yes stop_codon:yes gene_type:complete